jgi:hypothetical protein
MANQGREPKTAKALMSGREIEIKNQVNPEVDGSGHWEINGASVKFVPQGGDCQCDCDCDK